MSIHSLVALSVYFFSPFLTLFTLSSSSNSLMYALALDSLLSLCLSLSVSLSHTHNKDVHASDRQTDAQRQVGRNGTERCTKGRAQSGAGLADQSWCDVRV